MGSPGALRPDGSPALDLRPTDTDLNTSPNAPRSTRALRIHGTIAHDLGIAIVSGQYRPGEVLPGEIAFADRLKVSRSAYREAIRILAAKGLVTSKPKTGTRVNEVSCWSLLDPDVLAWTFESEPSEAFVRDLFELRMIIEPAVAELAAVRRDEADLTAMREALDAMSHHGLAKQEGREADQRFHRALLQAARNGPLLSLASSIEAAVAWTTAFKQRRRSLPPDPISEHRAVLESVERADPAGARAAMTQLVSLALDHTKAALRS